MNNLIRYFLLVVFCFLSTHSYAALVDGLVAHWSLDGNANDVTGNGHNGTIIGATPTSDRLGNANSAYSFDGSDYITVADSADFTLGNNPFTIAAWQKINTFSADGVYYLMGHSEGPGNTDKWILGLRNDGVSLVTTPTGWVDVGNYSFQTEVWHHVALQRDGNTLNAFIDGTSIGSVPFSATITDPAASLLIGTAEFDRPNRQFVGSIDDVRIYNRTLSISEIQSLATVPIPAAIWLFGAGLIGLLGATRRKTTRPNLRLR